MEGAGTDGTWSSVGKLSLANLPLPASLAGAASGVATATVMKQANANAAVDTGARRDQHRPEGITRGVSIMDMATKGTRRRVRRKLPRRPRGTSPPPSGILRNRRETAHRAGPPTVSTMTVPGVRAVVGLLDSAPVVLAIVLGIPAAIGVVVGLGLRRRTPALVLLAGSVVAAGVAVLAVWAVFQEPSVSTARPPGTPRPAGRPLDFSCAPSGAQLEETARGIAFARTCLAAPAGQPFTIEFDNQDQGTPHNIHIYSADPISDRNARSLFAGDLVTGPRTLTYRVSALPAGRYFFHCDVHPSQMFGGLVVGGP